MKGTKRTKLIAVALALILSIGILAGWSYLSVQGDIGIDAKCGEENVEVASATATIKFTNADGTPALEDIELEFKAGSLIVPDAVKETLAQADEEGYTAKLTYTLNATGYDQVTGTADMKALVEESNDENVPTEFKAISASFVKTQYKLTFSNPKGVEQVLVNGEEVKDFSEGISVTYFDEIEIVVKEHYTCEESKIKNLTTDKNVMIGIDFDFEYEIVKSNANGKGWEWDTDATVSMKKGFDWEKYSVSATLNGETKTITEDSSATFNTSGELKITVTDKNDPTQTWTDGVTIQKVDGTAVEFDTTKNEPFTIEKAEDGKLLVKVRADAFAGKSIDSIKEIKLEATTVRGKTYDVVMHLNESKTYYIGGSSVFSYDRFDKSSINITVTDKAGNTATFYQSDLIVTINPEIYEDDTRKVKEVEFTIKYREGNGSKEPTVKFNGVARDKTKQITNWTVHNETVNGETKKYYTFTATQNGTYTIGKNEYYIYCIDTVGPVIDPVNIDSDKPVNELTVTVNDYCYKDKDGNYCDAGAGVKNVYFAQVTTSESVSATPLKENAENAEEVTGYKATCTITIMNSAGKVIDTVTGEATAQSASGEDKAKEAATETAKANFKTWLNDNRDNLGNIMTGEQVGETNQYVLKLKGDDKYQLAIWAEDNVMVAEGEKGNLSNVVLVGDETNKIIIDNMAPKISNVQFTSTVGGNETTSATPAEFAQGEKITATVTDANRVSAVTISYKYNGEEKVRQDSMECVDGTDNYYYVFNDGDGIYTDIVITAEDNTSPAKNTADKSAEGISFTIDTKKPTMSHVLDPVSATLDKGYFNCDRKLTATVEELHFASGTFVYKDLEAGENAAPIEVPFTVSENRSVGNFANNVFTYTFDKDGKYELVSMTLTDKAGNSNTYTFDGEPGVDTSKAKESFTVDKTAPTVKVDYSNQSPANDKYFNADRTATITVTEHNFNGEKVNIVGKDFKVNSNTASGAYIIITQNDKDAKGDARNLDIDKAWTTNGDTHTLKITYTGSVNYKFNVVVVDRAGNVSATPDYAGNKDFAPNADSDFDVDKVAPTITITGVTNGSAYNGEVGGTVEYKDANFQSATIRLMRADKNGVYDVTAQHTTALPNGAPGGTVNLVNFDRLLTNDGIYTLTATVVDMAGNTAENTVTFSVNRFGSTYKFDDYLASICDKHIKSVTDDLKITEINPDSITSGTVTITRNGKVIDSGDIAAVLQRSGSASGGWYEYLYTISKDLFKEDGMYKIVVSSKDAAGNEPNSENDEEFEIVFWVDDTPAEIAGIQGLEDAIINAENHTVKFTVRDNIGLKSVTVYCDGKEIAKFGEKDFTAGDLVDAQFTISEASSAQHIRIVAEDLSGNILDTDGTIEGSANTTVSFERDVTVSTNFFVRWFANKPLFFGSIAVIVAAGVGIYFIVAKKHKKEKATAE